VASPGVTCAQRVNRDKLQERSKQRLRTSKEETGGDWRGNHIIVGPRGPGRDVRVRSSCKGIAHPSRHDALSIAAFPQLSVAQYRHTAHRRQQRGSRTLSGLAEFLYTV
jgi:hypothetical protein